MELSIKTSKNGKITIYADGELQFTVPAVIWYSSHFREGDEITSEELTELKRLGDSSCAFESGMRMLSLRAHSEFELRHKLSMKFSPESADSAIEKLRGLGLLDDEKFAMLLAEELYSRKNFAPKRILSELKSRGISGEYAQKALNTLDINKDFGIIKVLEKSDITESSSKKEKDRIVRRLLNMGYSFSDISKYISFYE